MAATSISRDTEQFSSFDVTARITTILADAGYAVTRARTGRIVFAARTEEACRAWLRDEDFNPERFSIGRGPLMNDESAELDRLRDIEARAFVEIRFRAFVAKNILPVVGTERSGVFPLRVNRSIAFADRDPSIFARRNGWALIRFLEPRNNARGFRAVPCSCLVAVGERAVERILPGREFYGNIIAPMCGIGIVKAAVAFGPIFVPGTRAIRDWIISARLFTDPKDSCHDISFPWITLSRLGRPR